MPLPSSIVTANHTEVDLATSQMLVHITARPTHLKLGHVGIRLSRLAAMGRLARHHRVIIGCPLKQNGLSHAGSVNFPRSGVKLSLDQSASLVMVRLGTVEGAKATGVMVEVIVEPGSRILLAQPGSVPVRRPTHQAAESIAGVGKIAMTCTGDQKLGLMRRTQDGVDPGIVRV